MCRSVWYLKRCSDRFIAAMAATLRIVVYAQGEAIDLPATLCAGVGTPMMALRRGRESLSAISGSLEQFG